MLHELDPQGEHSLWGCPWGDVSRDLGRFRWRTLWMKSGRSQRLGSGITMELRPPDSLGNLGQNESVARPTREGREGAQCDRAG